jgi:hypothetical protein
MSSADLIKIIVPLLAGVKTNAKCNEEQENLDQEAEESR